MPSTLTHYIFNKEYIKDPDYSDIFLLGGQGADVLFFYGYSLSKREDAKDIRNLGATIHQINPDKLFMKMLSYAFKQENDEKKILISFVRGFMYHYCLDRQLHPYVFYNTGFPYTNKIYNKYHGQFESILDTLLMKKNNCNKSTRSVLKADKCRVKLVSKMLALVLNDYFNTNIVKEDTYYKAYKDFRLVRLVIDSKWGVKKSIFEKIIPDSPINNICQPHKVKDAKEYDYLNESNKIWIHPSSGVESNESVDDIMYKAMLDGRIVDTIIYNYKDNLVTERKITKFTQNINHDGKNLDNYMIYFKLIWDNKQ